MKPIRLPPKGEPSFVLPKKTLASDKELVRLCTLCINSKKNQKTTEALLFLERNYALSVLSLISKNARDSEVRKTAREKHTSVAMIMA